MKNHFSTGIALCLFTVLLWGAQFPIGKDAVVVLDGFHTTALRYIIGVVTLLGFLIWREGAGACRYYGRFRPVALAGVTGFTLSGLLVYAGLALTRPEHAAIIVSLQPVMATLASWWRTGQRPPRFRLGCVIVAFAGVVLVITRGDLALSAGGRELAGDALIFCGAMLWVTYTMLSERIGGWSSLRYTTLALVPGTLGILLVTLVLDLAGWLTVPSAAAIGSVAGELAFLGLGGVGLSMVTWTSALRTVGAVNAMLFTSLIPVIALVIRAAQGVRFDAIELIGAALVVGALVASNLQMRREAARARAAGQ